MIGIVILNYNNWELSEQCIESIRETCTLLYRIYLVDNVSTKFPPSSFHNYLNLKSDTCFIQAKENNGYAAGNNLGIARALDDGCEFILVSNNDVIFQNDSIRSLRDFLYRHKEYGIAGPKVFLPNGLVQEINMGCKMTLKGKYKYLLRKTPFSFIGREFVCKFHAEDKDLKYPFDVYAVSGCCFMMSDITARELYPLDENTFLYEEENIIGHRMEQIGLKTIYNTDSHIVHIGGESTKTVPEFSYRCFMESEMYYCKKYLGATEVELFVLAVIRLLIYIREYGFNTVYIKRYFKIVFS